MPRVSQKPVNVFNKGLITEAGELTFPEGASVDELNCALLRDGSRRRRLALTYEPSYTTSSSATLADGEMASIDVWENVAGIAGLNFFVVQLDNMLHFYTEGDTLSSNRKSFTVNLSTYARPGSLGAGLEKVRITSILGVMVVASPELNTFYVEYNQSSDTVSSTQISFRVRDFEWLGDRSDYSNSKTNPSQARRYDTKNSSWGSRLGSAALTAYQAGSSSKWPPLNLPWFSGKDADDNFSYDEYQKLESGTTLIGNGFYIYDLYNFNRSSQSGLSLSAFDYIEASRFRAIIAFSSRVFYAGLAGKNGSNVYFSRIIKQVGDLGECLQVNDPTSETFSDLLADDGGVINIPDAHNIQHLHTIGSNMFVFAENGVWVIRGIDDSFSATSYFVGKVTNTGIKYTSSFVVSDANTPYWWSELGIYTLVPSPDGFSFVAQNISRPTIQEFYNNISGSSRGQVVAAYDGVNSRALWMYPSSSESIDGKLTKALWLDEAIGAFYPWEIGEGASGEYVVAPFFLKGTSSGATQYDVVDSSGNLVVDSSGNQVIVERGTQEYGSVSIKLLVRTGTSNRVSFAEFTGTDFLDWGITEYSSYVEGPYDFTGDLTTKKSNIYITTFFKTTETGMTEAGDGSFSLDRPSSCLVSTYWDYKTTPSQSAQEVYRLKELPIFDGGGDLNYPKTVVTSRLRLRGRGRSFRIRFESTGANDFHLLGYDVLTQSKGSL
jgi:hypothetical protein